MLGCVSLADQNTWLTCEPNVIDNHVANHPAITITYEANVILILHQKVTVVILGRKVRSHAAYIS